MVTRKSWMGLSLAAALAVCTSAGQAQQPKAGNPATPPKVRTVNYQAEKPVQPTLPTPKPVAPAMELGSAKPVPGINATGMACAPNGAKSNVGFCCRLWRWLTFRPVTHHSILCCKETSCTPPLYAYFLEHCPPGSAGGHAQPCANGQCIARMTRPEARVADAPKVVSRPMTERAAAKPSAPAQRPVVREEVQAVVRKVSGEAKPARDETCLEGKECGKWRMLPTKMSDLGRR